MQGNASAADGGGAPLGRARSSRSEDDHHQLMAITINADGTSDYDPDEHDGKSLTELLFGPEAARQATGGTSEVIL